MEQELLSLSIYVHIPFCTEKCGYCDFVSYPLKDINSNINYKLQQNYFNLIAQELSIYDSILKNSQLDPNQRLINTIYFGGGTPSVISPDYISQTLKHIRDFGIISDNPEIPPEITLEANPESFTETKLQAYKKLGINRISLGIQSSNDQTLKQLGRLHSFAQAKKIHQVAQDLGFNTSVDLIYGLPNQTIEDLKDDLENFLQLNPNHISAYALTLEPEVPLYKKWHQERNDDKQAQFYQLINQTLENHNYQNYEISNWSKPSFESQHNSNYWNTDPNRGNWLGLGVAAYSAINFPVGSAPSNSKKPTTNSTPDFTSNPPSDSNPNSNLNFFRWNNPTTLEKYTQYIDKLNQKNPNLTFQDLNNIEALSLSERLNEKIMLGLRTKQGLNLSAKSISSNLALNSASDLELLESLHQKTIHQILEPIKDLINYDDVTKTITVKADHRFIVDSIIRKLII